MNVGPSWKGRDNFRLGISQSHENRVHWFRMKNITLSADEDLIERARSIAREQRRTLNAAFREWLTQFTQSAGDAQCFDALMKHLRHVDAGGHFGRDELNER
jgi:predicted transcriptional regulator